MKLKFILAIVLGLLLFVACQQNQAVTTFVEEEEATLFSEEDINNAILQIADDVTVLPIRVGEVIPDGVVVTTDSNGEEDSLTTLLDVNNLSGYVCNIINNTNGRNKWRIQSVNAADESVIGLFAVKQDGRAMQSIGCNAEGNKAVFAMKTSSAADYEIFLLDYTGSTRQAYQLTDNSTNDIDVSMSAGGNTIVWQSWIGNDKVITVREYAADGSFTDTILDGPVPYVEPSVNSDGTLIAFLDIRSDKTNLLRHNLNNGNTGSVYSTSGQRSLAHPSVSNNGKRVAWMDGINNENFKVKDLTTNTITEIVSNNSNLDHGFLADDGNSVVYSINRADKAFMKVKNINDGTIKNVGRVLNLPARYRGSMWVRDTPPNCGYNTQIITGDQTIITQADVNALAMVNKIDGDLILNPSTDLNLSPLNLLTEITGTFQLASKTIQTTLTGFDCLKTVGEDFAIEFFTASPNTALASISGFSVLDSVGGDFKITHNAALTNVDGFSKLQSVDGYFYIYNNDALLTLDAFTALKTVGSFFEIARHDALTSIADFSALKSVGWTLNFTYNLALTSAPAFPKLTSVAGDFNFYNNHLLSTIPDFPVLESITGYFKITNNYNLLAIPNFPVLGFVNKFFEISNNDDLVTIPEFSQLSFVGSSFIFTYNDSLTSIPNFPNLTSVGWNFSISYNDSLTSVPSFSGLSSVGGYFSIFNNDALTSLSTFNALTSIDKGLSIGFNDLLTDINGFSALNTIVGEFTIENNTALTDISAFSNLSSIGWYFSISDNNALTNLSGFTNLSTITSFLEIADNLALEDISDFSALTTVGSYFSISGNGALTSISAFSALTSTGSSYFSINNNDSLLNLSAFPSLSAVGGHLLITNNDVLATITGLTSLTSGNITGSSYVRDNAMLDCQSSTPSFSPVDVSTGNLVNCL